MAHGGFDIVSHWGPLSWPLPWSQNFPRRPWPGAYKAPGDPPLLEYHFHLSHLVCRALFLSRILSEDGLDDELVDDLEEGPDDNMEDGLSNDSGSGSKEDSNIGFGYVLTALIVT